MSDDLPSDDIVGDSVKAYERFKLGFKHFLWIKNIVDDKLVSEHMRQFEIEKPFDCFKSGYLNGRKDELIRVGIMTGAITPERIDDILADIGKKMGI